MRYVAFFFLLLLSLYFLFLKPYLSFKRIFYHIDGASINISPFKIAIKDFYIYIPYGGNYYFLKLNGFTFSLENRPKLTLREGMFTLIYKLSEKSERKGEIPKVFIPEILKESSIKVDKFLVTIQGKRNITVLVSDMRLENRTLGANMDILVNGTKVKAILKDAYLGKTDMNIGDLRLFSDRFNFKIAGFLTQRDLKAKFKVEGTVREFDSLHVRVSPVKLRGEGVADYWGVKVWLVGKAKEVDIKGRKRFKDVMATADVDLRFGKGLVLSGKIWNEDISGDYNLELIPKRFLTVKINSFPVDSPLLGISPLLLAWVKGNLDLDLDSKELKLSLKTDNLAIESISFGKANLDLLYNYGSSEGKLEIFSYDPGSVRLSGTIKKNKFIGRLKIDDIFIIASNMSLFLSYNGTIEYRENLFMKGYGRFKDLFFRDFPVGGGIYWVDLRGEKINLTYSGEGFSGFVKGKLKRELVSINDISDLRRKVRSFNIFVERGKVELSLIGKRLTLAVDIPNGSISRDKGVADVSMKIKVVKEDKLRGNFEVHARRIDFGDSKFGSTYIEGDLEENILRGTYKVADLLKGTFTLDIRNKMLTAAGVLSKNNLALKYRFRGNPEEGELKAKASLTLENKTFNLTGTATYTNREFEIKINPGSYTYKTAELVFGGAVIKGNINEGRIGLAPTLINLFGKPIVRIEEKVGRFSISGRNLTLEFTSSGAVAGTTVIDLSPKGGFKINSQGSISLERLSFFTSTPLGGKAQGSLNYSLSYVNGLFKLELKNRGKVVAFSRYMALPMNMWFELQAISKDLSAFLTVWKEDAGLSANVGSLDLKNYYVYVISRNLPVLYREKDILASLKVSSEGWIDIKDLRNVKLRLDALISGDVELGKSKSKGKRKVDRKARNITLDIHFASDKPLRVFLPEGNLYVKIKGWVGGKADNPEYSIIIEFLSGELTYFGRRFLVRSGTLVINKEKGEEEKVIDISLVNPSEDMNIYLNLKGSMEDLKLIVWSEPPRSTQEILTKLIIGSTAEGMIPVAKTLFKQLGYVGNIRSGLAGLLGVEITFSTQTGSQGEIGFNVNIRKKIARALSVEYQQSTLKDPRATYYGGSVSLPRGFSFYGRVFSNKSSELKLRFIRKFDF